ncbi:MAG TPA: oxidoreductase [Jatrophihabitantaceae bacterium]|jgi:NAD(P)-dependent dehydrogenase (short-subunit alcohol dehydrogenase family)|nr:oxidoreductase [Jatrophihabitantaceae bacterium]
MTKWTAADIPDLSGRTYVVTGANSGLGASTARELAAHGGAVIMACRNVGKAERVAASIGGKTEVRALDLSDLASVRAFAESVDGLDVLVNNAGVMALPLGRTKDGFETQFGTNHLGHFALTGLLLPKVRDRVVTVSSGAHRLGRINLADPNWEHRRYSRWRAYGQSKLANLMFAYELQRRLTASGSAVISVAAHPGYANTDLQSHTQSIQDQVMAIGNRYFAQSADMGALPTLYAATAPDAVGGAFYGPDGFIEQRGYPHRVGSTRASRDEVVARALWQRSEDLTGVRFL